MKSTLLVIDVQNDYFGPGGALVLPDAEPALTNVQRLLAAARAAEQPVIHVRHESLDPQARAFQRGSAGAAFHSSIEVRPGEPVVLKHVPGSFTGTPLDQLLRASGSTGLVVCGFMTQQCCEMTTRQAAERGIGVVFVSDATAARALGRYSAREIHETTLAVISQYGAVRSTADVVGNITAA